MDGGNAVPATLWPMWSLLPMSMCSVSGLGAGWGWGKQEMGVLVLGGIGGDLWVRDPLPG